jgi:hypothetical protein
LGFNPQPEPPGAGLELRPPRIGEVTDDARSLDSSLVRSAGGAAPRAGRGTRGSDAAAGPLPGESYHWMFITRGTIDAGSADIAVYNAFVNAEAPLQGGNRVSILRSR